jgi:hypothetical protein
MTDDFNAFLMGGGTTSAKFPTIGTSVTGTICRQPEVQQQTDVTTGELKFWPSDNKPMQQLQVVLQTTEQDDPDDDGQRAIYVKGKMQAAVRDAVRKSGAKGLEVGGALTVTFVGEGESPKRGMNPPKLYSASYTPATAAAAAEFLGTTEPTPAAAPVQQAAPSAPAPAGVDQATMAALQNLTPAQRAALFPNGVPA